MADETPPPYFGPTQWRVISGALTLLSVGAIATLAIYGMIALGSFVGYFSSVIWPLAVAGVLALILRPVVGIIERKV